MKIGIPKEIKNNEFRVGITPEGAKKIVLQKHTVLVENNAGLGSGFTNNDYLNIGARGSSSLFLWTLLEWVLAFTFFSRILSN